MMLEKPTARRLEAMLLTPVQNTLGKVRRVEKSLEVMVVMCISCRQFS